MSTESRFIDIKGILALMPHRYPMLLVDRVEIVDPDLKVRGLKNVTFNEPYFSGHYPGEPIMPGVLIIEAVAQTGGVLFLSMPKFKGMVPLIGAIDDVRFRKPVVPGDRLEIEVTVLWLRGQIGRCHADATVDGQLVASLDMTFKVRPNEGAAGA